MTKKEIDITDVRTVMRDMAKKEIDTVAIAEKFLKDSDNPSSVHHDNAQELIWGVIEGAAMYFKDYPRDFGIQHSSSNTIVFGGSNRLIWSPVSGYSADRSYCSSLFLMNHDKLQLEQCTQRIRSMIDEEKD